MNAIIIEDEKLILQDLTNIINRYAKKIKIVESFTNGVDSISYLNNNDIDVMFVDINIPLLDGMNLAKTISKFEKKPYIVFITAHKEYAAEAFEIGAFDYILKPYSIERIKEVIEKIEEQDVIKEILTKKDLSTTEKNIESKSISKIQVKENNNITFVNLDEIYFFKAKDKFTFVHTRQKQYEMNNCIAEVEEQVSQKHFFRCHRSFIVNIDKIKSIESNGVSSYKLTFEDIEEEVPVGRRKIKDLKAIMDIK